MSTMPASASDQLESSTLLEPTLPAAHRLPFQYHGDGGSLFVLLLKNVLLTLITLGIYLPWAKTARRQYLARAIGNPYTLTDSEVETIGANLRKPHLLKKVWDYHHAKLGV